MATLLDNLNEQLFTDISSEQAEMIQGGSKFNGYDAEGKGYVAEADRGIPNLKSPNTIDYVYINEGLWQLYDSDNYKNPIGNPIGPTNGNFLFLSGLRNKANSVLKVG